MAKSETEQVMASHPYGLRFWRRFDDGLTLLENVFFVVAGVLVAVSLGVMIVSVFGRYFLEANMAWSIELSEYMMLYIAFLAAPWILRNDHHVKVELLLSVMKEGIRHKINIATSFLAAVACLILFWFSLDATIDHFRRGIIINNVLGMPKYIPLFIIPIGSLLLFLRYVHKIWGLFIPKN